MLINQVAAHLIMLGFIKIPRNNTHYEYSLHTNNTHIRITISKKNIAIFIVRTDLANTGVRTNHEQGLNYLTKFLYNLEQEISTND